MVTQHRKRRKEPTTTKKRNCSRRKYQQFYQRKLKSKQRTEEYIAQEPQRKLNQSINDTKKELAPLFGFAADPSKSLKSNIRTQLFNKPLSLFTNHMQNMAYHNLLKIEKITSNASKLLGLGIKLCLQSRLPKTDY